MRTHAQHKTNSEPTALQTPEKIQSSCSFSARKMTFIQKTALLVSCAWNSQVGSNKHGTGSAHQGVYLSFWYCYVIRTTLICVFFLCVFVIGEYIHRRVFPVHFFYDRIKPGQNKQLIYWDNRLGQYDVIQSQTISITGCYCCSKL